MPKFNNFNNGRSVVNPQLDKASRKENFQGLKNIPKRRAQEEKQRDKFLNQKEQKEIASAVQTILNYQEEKQSSKKEIIDELLQFMNSQDTIVPLSFESLVNPELVLPREFELDGSVQNNVDTRRLRIGLIILTLITIFNGAASDQNINSSKVLEELFASIKTTRENIGKVVNSRVDDMAKKFNAASEAIFNLGSRVVAPIALTNAVGKRSRLPTVVSALLSLPGVDAVINKDKEFTEFWHSCATGKMKAVKEKLLKTKDLETLLTSVDPNYLLSPLCAAVNEGKVQSVKEILNAIKDKPDLLKKVLQMDEQGVSPLYTAAGLGENQSVKEILNAIKDNKDLLREILMWVDEQGVSPLYAAANQGREQSVKEILNAIKDKPDLLEDVLMQVDKKRLSPLCTAANLGRDQSVKEILDSIKDNKDLLGKVLMQVDEQGVSPLYAAANQGREQSVKEILNAIKDNKDLLRKVLMWVNRKEMSPLCIAASLGKDQLVIAILDVIIKEIPNSLEELIKQKPNDLAHLPIINNLIISGNFEAVRRVLDYIPNISIESLPQAYYSTVPKKSIYYLEAFLGSNEERPKYFKIQKNGNKEEVTINKIQLSSDDPIIVEMPNHRKVILGSDLSGSDLSGSDPNGIDPNGIDFKRLKKILDTATKHKIRDAVINIVLSNQSSGDGHAVTLKFSKNNNLWDVLFTIRIKIQNCQKNQL